MNTMIIIATCIIIVALIAINLFFIITFIGKIKDLQQNTEELSEDSDKLKKVSVGNYLDIIRIKKHVGMDTEDSETENTKSKES